MKPLPKARFLVLKGTNAWLICLLSLFMIGLFVVAPAIAVEPQYGGTLRVAMTPPRSLDPHMETYQQTTMVTNNTNNRLLRWNRDLTGVELDLAESWRRINDLTYEFKIRKGVRFHDLPPVNGRELTSADVKYSIERMAGMYGKSSKFKHKYYFENRLTSIETPDKYTIIFKTKEPYAPFIPYIASDWSAIVPKEAVEEFEDLRRKAIGTGPFMFKEFVRGSHITLVKNPNYFKKGLPYLDKIHIKIMRDPAAVMSAFLAKKLDAFGPYFFQVPTIKKEAPEAVILRRKSMHCWILRVPPCVKDYESLKPPFNDRRVRQAISMAIDKKKLLKLAWGGAGTVQIGNVPNFPPYSLTEADQVEYNPEKAKKLLAEAGYPNGFETDFITWNLPYMTMPAQVIKEMLKGVGIQANLKTMEMAQYFNKIYRFNYEMALHVMTAGYDPDDWLGHYFGSPEETTTYKWCNRKVWKLIVEQRRTLDKQKRTALIHEIQKELMRDGATTFLYTQDRFNAHWPYVHRPYYYHPNDPLMGELVWLEKH
ncbi:MAG: ABC transporter substrate-binding protein [Deltaproteobacteria bacterium]|nr:ABC transporter substrate-binding protein [Deltaproteobacteria bacterium]